MGPDISDLAKEIMANWDKLSPPAPDEFEPIDEKKGPDWERLEKEYYASREGSD